ncbi:hypothetical protein GOP47_0019798 [Adiantum capillus-veneris]|uniref:Uncharacterized protein n=1 Tax=Adiantum capillus-veneris TaxID=13818 RepID=A0A9D4UCQ4_ADICA|nr:hypothetical protein GOP47_0019798 [Adiantum capillus-veneris]
MELNLLPTPLHQDVQCIPRETESHLVKFNSILFLDKLFNKQRLIKRAPGEQLSSAFPFRIRSTKDLN